jgi:hypothetical protein
MKTKVLTAKEAEEILREWERRSLRVCLAVCMGELAWHAHWVGKLRNAEEGRWVLVAGATTNAVSIDQYQEIIHTEDAELVGFRLRQPQGGAPGFEVDLFIEKADHLEENALPLISRIIQ